MEAIITSILLCLLPLITFAQHQCLEDSPNYQAKYVQPILDRLAAKNYTIHSGYLLWVTNASKHGASPANSYGLWNIDVANPRLKPSPDAPMAMLFHPSDAILFTGCTAPKTTYIGFESYAYAKYRANGTNDSVDVVFSSHGAALNQYILNISNDYGSAPWDSIVTLIQSGDQVTFNDIYQEYVAQGIQHTVNNQWIPAQYLAFTPYNFTKYNYTVWTYPGRIDSFMPVARIINHPNAAEWKNYTSFRQPVYWITAEKLRDEDGVNPRVPFTELYTRNTTSDRDEFALQDEFDAFMNDTITYFEQKYQMQLVEQQTFSNYNLGIHDYGYSCYDNNWNCQGDLRDEQYWSSSNLTAVMRRHPVLHPDGSYYLLNDSYFVVMGVNHLMTNFTLYDNIVLYCMEDRLTGLYQAIGLLDDVDYNNSANLAGIPSNVSSETLAKFYMIQTARPWLCEGKNMPSMCPDEDVVGVHNKFGYVTRNVLNLETLTRPPENAIIPDVLLHFRLKNFD